MFENHSEKDRNLPKIQPKFIRHLKSVGNVARINLKFVRNLQNIIQNLFEILLFKFFPKFVQKPDIHQISGRNLIKTLDSS